MKLTASEEQKRISDKRRPGGAGVHGGPRPKALGKTEGGRKPGSSLRRLLTNSRAFPPIEEEQTSGGKPSTKLIPTHSHLKLEGLERTVTGAGGHSHRGKPQMKEYVVAKPARKKGLRGDPTGLHYQDIIMCPDNTQGGTNPGMTYFIRGKGAEIDRRSLLYQVKQNSHARNAGSNHGMKMCFVVTLYNEAVKEFKDSMKGIIHSIHELQATSSDFQIQEDDIGIFFVADGIDKLSPDLLKLLKDNDLYDEEMLEKELMCYERALTADPSEKKRHAYEYLWKEYNDKYTLVNRYQMTMQWDERDKEDFNPLNNVLHLFQKKTNEGFGEKPGFPIPRYNYFFGIKHINGGKLDSHLWFFRGLCGYLNPKYTFLIDLGTEPKPNSIFKLYRYMENNPGCGGCCGEIEVDTAVETPFSFELLMVLVQFVEYKISHFIDKAFESLFGFVSVLPGAFSMYRWEAIEKEPLLHYFKGLDKANLSCAQANMYLAEDRIMCLTIVTNTGRADHLFYVPGAKSVTDPPNKLGVFIKQRRRWINGSNFATLFVLANFINIYRTNHGCGRKAAFTFLFFYQVLNTILAFMLPGCSYAAFSVLARAAFPIEEDDSTSDSVTNPAIFIENIYLLLMLYIMMWSLAKEVTTSGFFYGMTVFLFGLISYFAYYTLVLFATKSSGGSGYITLIGICLLLAVFVVPIIMNIHRINGVVKYLVGFFVYLFFTPFYLNVLIIYSFANTHDVSWGNRPASVGTSNDAGQMAAAKEKADRELKFKSYRTILLCVWMTLNIITCYFIVTIYRGTSSTGEYYMAVLMAYIAFIMISRLLGSIIFTIVYEYCGCGFKKPKSAADWKAPTPLRQPDNIPIVAMTDTLVIYHDVIPEYARALLRDKRIER